MDFFILVIVHACECECECSSLNVSPVPDWRSEVRGRPGLTLCSKEKSQEAVSRLLLGVLYLWFSQAAQNIGPKRGNFRHISCLSDATQRHYPGHLLGVRQMGQAYLVNPRLTARVNDKPNKLAMTYSYTKQRPICGKCANPMQLISFPSESVKRRKWRKKGDRPHLLNYNLISKLYLYSTYFYYCYCTKDKVFITAHIHQGWTHTSSYYCYYTNKIPELRKSLLHKKGTNVHDIRFQEVAFN